MTVTSISTTIAILFCVLVLIPTTAMAAPLNNNERHYSVENEWDEILGNIENGIMMDRQQQPGIRVINGINGGGDGAVLMRAVVPTLELANNKWGGEFNGGELFGYGVKLHAAGGAGGGGTANNRHRNVPHRLVRSPVVEDEEPLVHSRYNSDCFFTPMNCLVGRARVHLGNVVGRGTNSQKTVLYVQRRPKEDNNTE